MNPASPVAAVPTGNRILFRFIVVSAVIYLAWFFGYEQWLAHDGRLDNVLCNHIATASVLMLRLVGFEASISSYNSHLLLMNEVPSVIVGPPCNGLVLYALFGGFVVAYPGAWQRKLWYIPVGVLLIWILNVMRVAALAVNHYYAHASVDFNHHYTFTFVVYAFIFGLWMLWARRLAPLEPTDSATVSPVAHA